MEPILTILITSYNKEKYISYVLEMLKAQNCSEIVVHIIDDGSTDSSMTIINEIVGDLQNFNIHHWDKNRGTGYTRQYALDLVDTNYFIFIDADDMIVEDYVSTLLNTIKEDNTADIHHFNTRVYPLGGTLTNDFALWDKIISKDFLVNNNITFNSELTNMEDYNLRIRINKVSCKEIHHEKIIYIYNLLAEDTITHEKPIWYNHGLEDMRAECDPGIEIYNQ